MGKINVKGLGVVEIEGDKPTQQEANDIKKALTVLNVDGISNAVGDEEAQKYSEGSSFGRILTEVGGSILGSIAGGGFTLPGLVRQVGMRSMPFIKALAKASAASGAGGGAGAVVAQTFDPKEDIVKEVVRAAGEGALGEAVGAPLAIKAAPIIGKIISKPRQFAEVLQGSEIAEQGLKNKSYEILYGKETAENLSKLSPANQAKAIQDMAPDDEIIKKYMKDRKINPDEFETLKRSAIEAQKGLTPAFKTNNQGINIAETIISKSILGGAAYGSRYRALKDIGDKVAYDTVQELTEGSLARNKSEVGTMFLNMFNNADQLFRTASDSMYQKVDDLLGAAKTKPALSIFQKVGTRNSLDDTVKTLQENIQTGLGSGRRNPIRETVEDLASDLNKFRDPTGPNGLVSYKQLAKIRSDVAAQKQILKTQGVPKDELFQVDNIIKTMDDMMSPEFLRKSGLNPKAADALEAAKEFYEQGMNVFARGTTVAILAKGARETADLGTVFSRITDGEKTDLLGRVLNDIDQLPTLTKNPAFKEAIGNAITKQEANTLKESLRGHYLQNMLAKSFTEDVQFGGFYNIRKFTSALDNNRETLELLFKNKEDIIKLENLKTTLGFAQGRISDISGVPGGVLIQLKQAGAAGQVLQWGGGLLSPANVAVGGAAAMGGIVPALGVIIAPKYIGKAMLDPKFQELAFKSTLKEVGEQTNTPKRMQSLYNQMLGRLVTLGVIPEAEAKDVKDGLQNYLDAVEQKKESSAVPLPNVQPSDFPVIPQGNTAQAPSGSNTQMAQALNLFNKGGIVSAKKSF
jgi:hypothetical protein